VHGSALAAQAQLPARHCRRAQQGASGEHALPFAPQVEQLPATHPPVQQSPDVLQDAPASPHAWHRPPTQAKPSQHWLLLVQLRSVPRHAGTHAPSEQVVPAQQIGGCPEAPHGASGPAQVDWQVPLPFDPTMQPRASQQSAVVSQAPPASMQRGGPQTSPMHAPLQHSVSLFFRHELPSARQPREQRPSASQAKSPQQSSSRWHAEAKSWQEHWPATHEPEQQSLVWVQLAPPPAQIDAAWPPSPAGEGLAAWPHPTVAQSANQAVPRRIAPRRLARAGPRIHSTVRLGSAHCTAGRRTRVRSRATGEGAVRPHL
jgi:hypothetical protein